MKRTKQIAVVSVVALGLAGAGQLYAETHKTEASSQEQISETLSGGPGVNQQVELSEHGLAAINDIQLARVAVNDGYVDNAKDLLKEAKTLLGKVKSEDKPITVNTDVSQNGKSVDHQKQSVRADLIPIMSDMQVVESYSVPKADQTGSSASAKGSSQSATNESSHAAGSTSAKTDQGKARSEAIAKANEHLSKGERGAAAETLRLVDLALVDQTVSMPLSETTHSVDHALKLLGQNKLHQANLELKKVRDNLVLTTDVVAAPMKANDSGSGSDSQSKPATQAG